MAIKRGVPRAFPPGRDASSMRQRALELDLRAGIGEAEPNGSGVAEPVSSSTAEYRFVIVPLLQMEKANPDAGSEDFLPQDFADVARTSIDFAPYSQYKVVWCGKIGEGTNSLIPRYLDPADSAWKDWAGDAATTFTDSDTTNIPDTTGSAGAYTYQFWQTEWANLPSTVRDRELWIGINDTLTTPKISYLLQIHLRGGTDISNGGYAVPGATGPVGADGDRGSIFLGHYSTTGSLPAYNGTTVRYGDFAYVDSNGGLYRIDP